MKALIPSNLKVSLKIGQRYLKDWSSGQISQFTNINHQLNPDQKLLFYPQITITQALLPTAYSANKKHNLALAIQQIQDLEIKPKAIFSFWYLVGKPSRANGYLEGRSLVNNQLKPEVGGGLCQLSGLIYLLSLKAGLTILERHSHSQDIYTEETRFAPLGADATIVYGYKDLRVKNNLLGSICYRFLIEEHQISAILCSPQSIPEFTIDFQVQPMTDQVKVDTVRVHPDRQIEIINSTIY